MALSSLTNLIEVGEDIPTDTPFYIQMPSTLRFDVEAGGVLQRVDRVMVCTQVDAPNDEIYDAIKEAWDIMWPDYVNLTVIRPPEVDAVPLVDGYSDVMFLVTEITGERCAT